MATTPVNSALASILEQLKQPAIPKGAMTLDMMGEAIMWRGSRDALRKKLRNLVAKKQLLQITSHNIIWYYK